MLTPRNVVVLVIAIAVLSLVGAVVSLLGPPGAAGTGENSYSTRPDGFHGLVDVLTELRVPVDRSARPPTHVLDQSSTLVFWSADPGLVELEPLYLQQVADWVKAGGRVVVAPPRIGSVAVDGGTMNGSYVEDPDETAILHDLGVPDIGLAIVDLSRPGADAGEFDEGRAEAIEPDAALDESATRVDGTTSFDADFSGLFDDDAERTRVVTAHSEGELSRLEGVVSRLEVSEADLQVIELMDSKPQGAIRIRTEESEEYPIVALFRLGKGEVIVVSDPALARNDRIARQDNSVLAVHLLFSGNRPVLFDEFYHGLTIRGNPLWLLTRRRYAVLAMAVLGMTGLWIWRESVFLGPPLKKDVANRRSIGEYVDAMARFLLRGSQSRPFVLREVRDGVLWALRQKLGLPPGRENPEALAAVLSRRNADLARELNEAVALTNHALAMKQNATRQETLEALQRISGCL